MSFLRILTPIVIALGLVLTPLAIDSAKAAGNGPDDNAILQHAVLCEDGVCTLQVDLGDDAPGWLPAAGIALTVLEDNLRFLPEGAGVTVSDNLTFELPIGRIELADAEINLTMSEDGVVETFFGKAELPNPLLGLVGGTSNKKPIATFVGYDLASALPDVKAPLDPNRKYLFFDLAAGSELSSPVEDGTLWLTIPDGQRATVVIDPQERFAYVDGNVTLRYSGTMAFLTQLIDPAQTLELFNGELPIRHQATVHLTGVITDDLADSELEFAGRYAVDGGKVGEWLKLNGEPLALEGGVLITDEGVLGTGAVRSTLFPENVWDSAVQAQVFVPFSRDVQDAYIALDSRLDIPFAKVSMDGYAMLDGAMDVVADGSFSAPWTAPQRDLMAQSAADEVEIAVMEATGADEENAIDAKLWSRTWDATMGGVQTSLQAAKKPAGAAAEWVKNTAGTGYESASGGIEWSIDVASSRWCSTIGFCRGQDNASITETAMK